MNPASALAATLGFRPEFKLSEKLATGLPELLQRAQGRIRYQAAVRKRSVIIRGESDVSHTVSACFCQRCLSAMVRFSSAGSAALSSAGVRLPGKGCAGRSLLAFALQGSPGRARPLGGSSASRRFLSFGIVARRLSPCLL